MSENRCGVDLKVACLRSLHHLETAVPFFGRMPQLPSWQRPEERSKVQLAGIC